LWFELGLATPAWQSLLCRQQGLFSTTWGWRKAGIFPERIRRPAGRRNGSKFDLRVYEIGDSLQEMAI
jgi:hypothetical protein